MAKKRKKKVVDNLAKKRGRRTAESRLKRKKLPKTSRKTSGLTEEGKKAAETALLRSHQLLSLPGFDRLHLDPERLTGYLESVKESGLQDPREFVTAGLRELVDEELLENVKLGLSRFIQVHGEEDPESALSASLVLTLMKRTENLAPIPFFVVFFIREVSEHPMADDPSIWKLLSTFLPSRIVKPEDETKPRQEEAAYKRSEDFPHIVIPRGYAEGDRQESDSEGR